MVESALDNSDVVAVRSGENRNLVTRLTTRWAVGRPIEQQRLKAKSFLVYEPQLSRKVYIYI